MDRMVHQVVSGLGDETGGGLEVVRLIVSYRGGAYAGWQRQANALAVQEVLEEAVAALLRRPVRIVGASRTDAGVHARGQAAHLEIPPGFPVRGLVHGGNHLLPADIRILSAVVMPAGFHARRQALAKEYSYRLIRRLVLSPLEAPFAVRAPAGLDVGRMAEASRSLAGHHDFSAFALAGGAHGQPVRRIDAAAWEENGEELVFRITGNGFLRGMVRGLVGTLLEVGTGRRTAAGFAGLLSGGPRARAGPTAPAHGLVLEKVFYPPGPPGLA